LFVPCLKEYFTALWFKKWVKSVISTCSLWYIFLFRKTQGTKTQVSEKKRVIGNSNTANSMGPMWQQSDCRFFVYVT